MLVRFLVVGVILAGLIGIALYTEHLQRLHRQHHKECILGFDPVLYAGMAYGMIAWLVMSVGLYQNAP